MIQATPELTSAKRLIDYLIYNLEKDNMTESIELIGQVYERIDRVLEMLSPFMEQEQLGLASNQEEC